MPCEWCGNELPYPMRPYCCGSCRNSAMRHAADVMGALLEGDEPPDKPEHTHRGPEVKRWSPVRMQERIDEFRPDAWPDTEPLLTDER